MSTDFVLYAQRSISIGSHDSINGGDLGVRTPTAAAFGPQLIVSDHVSIDSANNLLAPSVSLGSHSAVGDVQTNSLQNSGAILRTQASFPASLMPPVPLATTPLASGANLNVASHQAITLSPGNYGTLTIADHAAVTLSAGTYSFASATIADHTSISTNAAGVTIQIAGSLSIAGLSSIAPSGGGASKLNISVAGVDASPSAPAASIGSHVTLTALIAAPHGTISVADHVSFTGALAAFDIAVSDHAAIQFQDGFPTVPVKGQQLLAGYITPAIASAPIVGPVPPDTVLSVSIGLPVTNLPALQAFVQNVSDPSSSTYRQYLSVDQFAATFGATSSDYAVVSALAAANGLTIAQTFPNNLYLALSGTVAAIESAFFVNLNYLQRPDGTVFFAPDQEPSLNTATPVLRISGLDSFRLPKPGVSPGPGSGADGSWAGVDFRNSYAAGPCSALTGTGQTIGLMEYDFFTPTDITAYEAEANLPNVPITTGFVAFGGSPASGTTAIGRQEVSLDIEVVASMAPGANIFVLEASDNGGTSDENSMLNIMATTTPRINQISISWIPGADDNTHQALYELAAQGQSYFQSSGDFGVREYLPASQISPQSTPITDTNDSRYAVAASAGTIVGGTILTMNVGSNGIGTSYKTETGWFGSGGGVFSPADTGGNAIFTPPYQQAQADKANSLSGVSTVWRNAPDVAMVAFGARVISDGLRTNVNGTSISTPLWAAYAALINQQGATNGLQSLGFANPALYSAFGTSATAFNDIASGNNGSAGVTGNNAYTGYDLVTGLGSPTCGLVQILGGPFSSGGSGGTGGSSSGESVTIGVKANEGGGPDICVDGAGFPPGTAVRAQYVGIPGVTVAQIRGPVTVASDGTFSLDEFSFDSIQDNCTTDQLEGTVSVTAIDANGDMVTAGVSAEFWCPQGLGGGQGTCP